MATIHPIFKDKDAMTSQSEAQDSYRTRSGGHTHPPLMVLSTNTNLLEIVRRAAPSGSRVVDVADNDSVMTQAVQLRPGILVLDTAQCKDISGTVAQLLQDLPTLAVVVAGKSEESAHLMKLAAAGQIYRFLLTPLSHSQTKLTLEAAMTQHLELGGAAQRRETVSNTDGDDTRKNYLPAYIGLGAALVLVVGGVFWGISRTGNNDATPAAGTAVVEAPAAKELQLADAALAAGKLLEPPGESALDLYRSALSIDPKSARAKAGIDNVAGKLLEQAEAALTAEQLEAAVTAIEQARDVSPENSRLKFLDGQVARERDRLKMTQAQDVSKKVRTLVADAQSDMEAGRLIFPSNNNAREALAEARKLDPTDPSIAQMQRLLGERLIEVAKVSAEQGQTDQARSLISAARQMGFVGAELNVVERLLNQPKQAAAPAPAPAAPAPAPVAVAPTPTPAPAPVAAAPAPAPTPAAAPAAPAPAAASASSRTAPVALKRIKTVTPIFPDAAKKTNTSGWVQVAFIVTTKGAVDDIVVTDASPKGVFDGAAIDAVSQWRFEPPMRDGKAVSQATTIRLRFDVPR